MEETYRIYASKGFKVFMINLQEQRQVVSAFVENNKFTSTVLLDKKGDVARKYHVMGLPVSFLIDKNGERVLRTDGFTNWNSEKLRSLVNALLAEESGGS